LQGEEEFHCGTQVRVTDVGDIKAYSTQAPSSERTPLNRSANRGEEWPARQARMFGACLCSSLAADVLTLTLPSPCKGRGNEKFNLYDPNISRVKLPEWSSLSGTIEIGLINKKKGQPFLSP
jgi:hypothetical protein